MKISIGVPPGPQARDLAVRAEALGYDRVWLYDSAALYEDLWIHLARAAEATERIGLGTAVMVPNLRHVMTTASAIVSGDAPSAIPLDQFLRKFSRCSAYASAAWCRAARSR